MPVPVLRLNLAPPPTIWRQHHQVLGWACLIAGSVILVAATTLSFLAYRDAIQAGKDVVLSTAEAREAIRKQLAIQDRLRSVDVEKELPVWRLAERILSERSLPWSRLTAELERSLVQDVRLKSIQRTRNASQSVDLKLRGEAKSRAAEEDFVTALQKNPFFAQVILERESDRQGGGVEFEYTLPIAAAPPAFVALPKFGPPRVLPVPTPKPAAQAARPAPLPPPAVPPPAPVPVSNPPVGHSEPQPAPGRPVRFLPNGPGRLGQPTDLSREARP